MAVKSFVSSACFTGSLLPPVHCPLNLNQRLLLFYIPLLLVPAICLSLSLSVSINWYDYISITCRCISSPKTNTKSCSVGYNKQNLISNFRYICKYYRQLHKPMFSFRTFWVLMISWWSKVICLCWSCGTQKSKGCSERKLTGHWSSNFSASPCGPRVTSSWTPVFGCQVVFFLQVFSFSEANLSWLRIRMLSISQYIECHVTSLDLKLINFEWKWGEP